MRTESLTRRPFFNLPKELVESFRGTAIRFSADEDFQEEPSLKVAQPPHECQVEVLLPDNVLSMLASTISPEYWRLVVVLTDETRRRLRSLSNASLPSASASIYIPTSNLNISWMGRKGATLSVYLALGEDREKEPGLPFRYAQIAAMKHFGINRTGPGADFPVEFWPSERIQKAGFQGEPTVLVIGDPEGLSESSPEDIGLTIVINDKLRAAFAHARRLRGANVLQDNVRSQAIAQLLMQARAIEDLDPDCVGYRFAKQVLATCDKEPEALLRLSDVEVFAVSQVFCGLTESAGRIA